MLLRLLARSTAALLLLCGCQTMSASADVPAVITQPDDASRAALQSTISSLFGDQNVMLADGALTQSSLLLIEHGPRGSLNNPPATGRVLEAPLRFRLVKNGNDCVLIDLRDDSRHVLANTRCTPE